MENKLIKMEPWAIKHGAQNDVNLVLGVLGGSGAPSGFRNDKKDTGRPHFSPLFALSAQNGVDFVIRFFSIRPQHFQKGRGTIIYAHFVFLVTQGGSGGSKSDFGRDPETGLKMKQKRTQQLMDFE